MNKNSTSIRVALVGCGTVAEQCYVPALRELERLGLAELVSIVDVDCKRLNKIETFFGKISRGQDLSCLFKSNISLAIVASPVAYHAEQTVALLQSGISVLCEKPMAATISEAEAMIKASKENNTLLAVGLFRRYLSVSQTIKQLIAEGVLGKVKSFYLCEGVKFDWPTQTPLLSKDRISHTGVLLDLGVHLVDLMLWWFGEPSEITYEDDNMGGIELNARLRAAFKEGFRGEVRLSWDWPLTNGCAIEFEKGWIKINAWNDGKLECGFYENSFGLDGVIKENQFVRGRPFLGDRGLTYNQSFIAQLCNVISVLRGEEGWIISGEEGIKSLKLIEHCYKHRTLMAMPWLSEKERSNAERLSGGGAAMRVALLGASGFVGTRILEMFTLEDIAEIKAVVRTYASLTRISKLNVDYHLADALNYNSLYEAFKGCEVVIHAVTGNPDVITGCVEPCYRAAERAKIRRIIYLSTASVHGQAPAPGTSEASPLSDKQKFSYNNAKVKAEKQFLALAKSGQTEVVALRPGIVFGPRDKWVSAISSEIAGGTAYLVEGGSGICNSIYVDNLVHAIKLAMVAEKEKVNGEAFLVGDAEEVTWASFYGFIANALGVNPATIPSVDAPVFRQGFKERIESIRTSKITQKILPLIPSKLKRSFKAALLAWSEKPAASPWRMPQGIAVRVTEEMARLHQCRYKLPFDKARQILSYEPPVSFDEGMKRTCEWLQFCDYLVKK